MVDIVPDPEIVTSSAASTLSITKSEKADAYREFHKGPHDLSVEGLAQSEIAHLQTVSRTTGW